MFFFIGGVRTKTTNVGISHLPCPRCNAPSTTIERIDNVAHAFFIPLFNIHKGTPFRACERCGWVEGMPGANVSPYNYPQHSHHLHQRPVEYVPYQQPSYAPNQYPSSRPATAACEHCGNQITLGSQYCPNCAYK